MAKPRIFGRNKQWSDMTMLRVWHALVYLGDGAVLIPCAALLFVWLIAAPMTRRSGWWWLLAMLLVSAGVALSKMLYMVTGWSPSGWNFTGLSGHAALSFLFFPVAAAFVGSNARTALRIVLLVLGASVASAISVASWMLREHSLIELVLGALSGALATAIFLTITWRHAAHTPVLRGWMIVSLLVLATVTYKREFPSTKVLSWIAVHVSDDSSIHTRTDSGS